jgi:DNA-binding XRE family transcriptional regulator
MDDLLQIGRLIEQERKAQKLTRAQLATHAEISERTIYQIETGANYRMWGLVQALKALKRLKYARSRRLSA